MMLVPDREIGEVRPVSSSQPYPLGELRVSIIYPSDIHPSDVIELRQPPSLVEKMRLFFNPPTSSTLHPDWP